MHFLYILYSYSADKFYIGESPDVVMRHDLHNKHHFKKSYTKIVEDWKIKLAFECEQRSDALYLERFVKRMKSKTFILKIIENPHILDDILLKR